MPSDIFGSNLLRPESHQCLIGIAVLLQKKYLSAAGFSHLNRKCNLSEKDFVLPTKRNMLLVLEPQLQTLERIPECKIQYQVFPAILPAAEVEVLWCVIVERLSDRRSQVHTNNQEG